MKAKMFWISAVVSLIAIVGSVMYAGDIEKHSAEKVLGQELYGLMRLYFMRAVYSTTFPDFFSPNLTGFNNKDVLEGIEGVEVFVEDIPPEMEKYGLREQLFQTDTELRLRQHGIKVVTSEESDSNRSKHDKQQLDFDARMYEFTLKGWARMPSHIMDEPFKTLFECLKLFEEQERGEFGPAEVLEREAECVKKFLEYEPQPMNLVALYVNVLPIIVEEKGLGAINVSVEVRETVILERKRSLQCGWAITWKQSCIVTRGLSRMDEVRKIATDLVDQFINDYLAANPKQQPTKGEVKNRDIFDQVEESTKP